MNTSKNSHWERVWSRPQILQWTFESTWAAHLKDPHEGEKAVLKRPLVVAVENERLQQLQDGEHVAEERHVVLLPELVYVQVHAAV